MEIQRKLSREVARVLEPLASYRRSHSVFEDWLVLSEAALEDLPVVVSAVSEGKEPPVLHKELFEEVCGRYHSGKERAYEQFSRAFGVLLESATVEYMDVVGQVYMDFAYPSKGQGQFFTPMNVCRMMAQMVLLDTERLLAKRLGEAARRSDDPVVLAYAFAGLGGDGEVAGHVLRKTLPLIIEHYEPISVMDPAVGSGRMLLAGASCFPGWAVQLGLVQFWGVDIDPTCVRMARINAELYGLNGRGARCWSTLSMKERAGMPEPVREVAESVEDTREASLLARKAMTGELEQLTLL